MKSLKAIGQVLAAIVYTCIFTGLLYMITVLPLAWLLTLRPVVLIIVLFLFGGLIQGVVFGLQTLIMMPYFWIVKNNVVSLIVSVGLILFNIVRNDVAVWKSLSGQGGSAIVIAVIITLLLVEALFMSIVGVVSSYSESREYDTKPKTDKKEKQKLDGNSSVTYINSQDKGFVPVSQMEKDTEFEVYWKGTKSTAVVGFKNESGHSVVDVVDKEGEPVEVGIDDLSDEDWEALRIKDK